MNDPFEDPSSHSTPPNTVREPSVQQAVTFLKDPRVKSSDPTRAISFLRQKGISEEELREAYRRVGLPFPHNLPHHVSRPSVPGQMYPPIAQFHGPPPPMHPVPVTTRPSWVSVFLGLTAAAGIYTAIRELLRRYIVPLYFPDAARIAEERRLREEHTFLAQERHIAELRERIQDLLVSSEKTNDQMEHLSKSISSSIALRERELSHASELRDAIQQLSRSVTVSGTTETSRLARPSLETQVDTTTNQHILNHAQKNGSLAYTHVNQTDTSLFRKSVDIQTDDVTGRLTQDISSSKVIPVSDGHVDAFSSADGPRDNPTGKEVDTGDDFMTIKPAEVHDSWVSEVFKPKEGEKEKQKNQVHAVSLSHPHDSIENGVISGNADTERDEINQVAASDTVGGVDQSSGLRVAIARELFQSEMIREARNAVKTDTISSAPRARPVSMPQLDTPLSDPE